MPFRPALCLALAALLATGCQDDGDDPVSLSCTTDRAQVARALERAPAPVRLTDGTRLSECVSRASNDAELQSFGTVAVGLADDLADRAARDGAAAVQLGYLVGAARRGSATTQGVTLELVHRLEVAERRVPAGRDAALERGEAAGERTG
jgi:hypothetical protein